MDPAVPWQYTYNRLAAQGATSGDLHHHFAQVTQNNIQPICNWMSNKFDLFVCRLQIIVL